MQVQHIITIPCIDECNNVKGSLNIQVDKNTTTASLYSDLYNHTRSFGSLSIYDDERNIYHLFKDNVLGIHVTKKFQFQCKFLQLCF